MEMNQFLSLVAISGVVCLVCLWAAQLFAPVLRQIARYLPHHRSENASKTHPKSSHDKFKQLLRIASG